MTGLPELADDGDEPAPRRGRRWGRIVAVLLLPVVLSTPWWLRPAATRLDYFRVRSVEVHGVRYMPASAVLTRLRVDTTASIWDDTDVLVRRVLGHAQIAAVRIERKLPGTLVVRVTENLPVALVAGARGLQAYDSVGRLLPFDPSELAPDLPVLPRSDTTLLRLLSELRRETPALFARVSEARRAGRNELVLDLPPHVVRATADLRAARLSDILPVEGDLARRHAQAAELDLRYRDQVIARLQ